MKNKHLLLVVMVYCMSIISTKAQSGIEGKWKDPKNGGVILIYEENGMYFGQLISADNPEENEKIKTHEKIVLLKNFKKESDTKFCCGTIYQPRNKRLISADLILEDESTLIVNGKYGIFRGSQTWNKL